MNQRIVDVTAARQDKQGNVAHRVTMTPVLKEVMGAVTSHDDISSAFKNESIFDFQRNYERTPLNAEREILADRNELSLNEENVEAFNPAIDVNEHRITLLARKYATKHMLPEDAARLDILTERFRNVMPGITENDLELMDGLNEQLNSVIELNNRLLGKYK